MNTHIEPSGLKIIQRYVGLEKRAGRNGDWQRAQKVALQVYRACALYGYTLNPY